MQKAFDYMEAHQMIDAGDKVIAGVSGGADSVCLLFLLMEYQRKKPFSLAVVHVEHGLRGEASLADAFFVEKICREHKIEYYLVRRSVSEIAREKKMTVEEAGRAVRYEAFEQIRRELSADKIAVAHNRDDEAETMLFQMTRGSGLMGAGGIRPVRGRIIRPLLCCSRSEIEGYLMDRGLTWHTDATNGETTYARNCIRLQVFPLLEREINAQSRAHLAALGEELRDVWDYMQQEAQKCADELCISRRGYTQIDIAGLLLKPVLLREYTVRECLLRAGCPLKDIKRVHIEALLALCTQQSGHQTALPGNWRARRSFEKLEIFEAEREKKGQPGFEKEIAVPGIYETPKGVFTFRILENENKNILQKTYTKWLDYDKIGNNLSIRTRMPGDYIIVNRQGGRKKLKEYLIEEKIPADERGRILLLAKGSEILWVIGHRISEAYKVLPETKTILEIRRIKEGYGGENQCIDSGGGSKPAD